MSAHISSKIKVHISDVTHIDKYKLLQSIVFLASDIVEPFEDLFEELRFVIADDEGMLTQGCFFVCDNKLYTCISPTEVRKAVEAHIGYRSFKKSLFFVILHELGHVVKFLQDYKKEESELEEFFDKTNNEIVGLKKTLQEEHGELSGMKLSRFIPVEIFCDRFAYKNLSYFESLYGYQGILI